MWQTDGTVYKLKPRSFHKFTYLQDNSIDFHFQYEPCLTIIQSYNHVINRLGTTLFVKAKVVISIQVSYSFLFHNIAVKFLLLSYLLYFYFYFLDNEEACKYSYMIHYIILYYKSRIWENELEE